MDTRIVENFLEDFHNSHRIAFLTGAGVSTDSGIPDFQTVDKNWKFPVSRGEATSIEYFHRNPKKFWEAYRYLFDLKQDVFPNSFHLAVAELETTKDVVVLTQNIDGLHAKAGTSQVGELHGNILWTFCSRPSCPNRVLLKDLTEAVPRCETCGKYLRPDVVLFGEAPRGFGDAKQVTLDADLLIVAGTALDVGPVNDLPRYREWYFPERPTTWVNKAEAPYGYTFTHRLLGSLESFASLLQEASSV